MEQPLTIQTPSTSRPIALSSFTASSAKLSRASHGHWVGVDRSVAIQNLMDVVSVSLLSNIVNADTSTSPLSRIQGDCSVQVLAFSYDRFRLLLSYGLGLLYTAICIAIGFYAIRVNGFEETLDFSRILKSVVHPGLFEHKDNLQYHQPVCMRTEVKQGISYRKDAIEAAS